ncbi:hypothetical protein GUITHDRAFT_101462 [Guillardia theta CCMP2712]|uniref:Photosynthesis system II assembly factor Ycf48/Hcf136-like domain-containing protein n=1 Tax=Guillardia theta (strain CCMP2712) TaxID=905079 RepID=L1JXS3_GUITC|nr:hypothetical protein GUITHDRAFT_101462 [Guillardia theta CCMP2712]EKX53015.1 hypothetical protein GUITHDRAFT_101462 [Guillardia theta CCMP2712]|eukprot:XP_005839995.1 hypothetical protein GUITHDRAFT_101462 [Guillardia theta CCMP2712]
MNLDLLALAQVQTVATPSNQFGVVVGQRGSVYVTQNGGFSWFQEKLEMDSVLDLTKAVAFEEESAIAFGGSCQRTVSLGSWERANEIAESYSSANCGIYRRAAGAPTGTQWNRIAINTNIPESVLHTFNAISFCNYTHGMIVGNGGLILRTENNGLSWVVAQSETAEDILDVQCHGSTVIASGKNAKVLRSTDGGVRWSLPTVTIPTSVGTISSLVMRNNVTAIALGQTNAYFTSDSVGGRAERIAIVEMVELLLSGFDQQLLSSASVDLLLTLGDLDPPPGVSFLFELPPLASPHPPASAKSAALPGLLQDCVGCEVIFLGGNAPTASNQVERRFSLRILVQPFFALANVSPFLSSSFSWLRLYTGAAKGRTLNDCVQLNSIAFSTMASSGLKNPVIAAEAQVKINGVNVMVTVEKNDKYPFEADVFGRQVETLLNMTYRPSVVVLRQTSTTIDVKVFITDQLGNDYVAKVKLLISLAEASEHSDSSICKTGIRRVTVERGAWGAAADVVVQCNGKAISDGVAIFLIVFFSVYGLTVISMVNHLLP